MIFLRDDFRIGLVISPRVAVLAQGEAESQYSYPSYDIYPAMTAFTDQYSLPNNFF
jgi:hypothetical protein